MRLAILIFLGIAASVAASGPKAPSAPAASAEPPAGERLDVPPPPFSEGIFPCSNCHAAMPVNRTRRNLTDMHTDIVLKHDEAHRWGLACHDATNRDWLHLASGERVAFTESYQARVKKLKA